MEFRDYHDKFIKEKYDLYTDELETLKKLEEDLTNKLQALRCFCHHIYQNPITDPHTDITTEECIFCHKVNIQSCKAQILKM